MEMLVTISMQTTAIRPVRMNTAVMTIRMSSVPWSYETDRPMSLELLRETAGKLPGNIYRVKGVVYSSDAPNRRAVLQVVGRRVDISI